MLKSYFRLTRQTLSLCFFLPVVVVVCSRWLSGNVLSAAFMLQAGIAALGALVCCILSLLLMKRLEPSIGAMSRQQAGFIDGLPNALIPWAIAAAAAASLALELAVIRWQGTVWEFFAFYKNYGLLSCFAGLGLGYALAKRDEIPIVLSIPLFAFQMLLFVAMRYGLGEWRVESLLATPTAEQLNMGFKASVAAPHLIAVYFFLGSVFLLTALTFIPVGQVCGRLLERTRALRAYGLNLLGSIAGTLAVLVLSMFWTPPVIWFIPCFAVLLILQSFRKKTLIIGLISALAAVAVLDWPVSFLFERVYSPYQLLERGRGLHGLTLIRAAGHYYQRVHDLSARSVEGYPDKQVLRDYYEFPYKLLPNPGRVAIVGAGTGNDVAAALRRGAGHVDAIEIDPAILEMGAHYHPEAPYDDERVTRIVNDARTFLRSTDNTYDLIVYGVLDSHTLLSHASSVRLDSFVYTVEGFRDARKRLKDGGVLSLSFAVLSPEIARKIYLMMAEAFDGNPPVCIETKFRTVYIFNQSKEGDLHLDPGVFDQTVFEDVTEKFADPAIKADISTDDWPFFYMPRRMYPVSYTWMMGLILVISIYLFWSVTGGKPHLRYSAYFFMGAGFMLVETKAITELGLMFGNTWQVIGIVIIAVLVMAYLANLIVMKLGIRRFSVPLILLIFSLGAGLLAARMGGMPSSPAGKVLSVAILTVPMFFSGIAFSSLLANSGDIAGALAMNLLGAMCGGLLEYNSMYFGFQFLYWMAMGVYVLVLVTAPLAQRK